VELAAPVLEFPLGVVMPLAPPVVPALATVVRPAAPVRLAPVPEEVGLSFFSSS
jgi:hypothetical protein